MENNEKKSGLTNKLGQGDFSLKRVGRKKKWDKKGSPQKTEKIVR